jgi:hypothetical protein
MGWRQITVAHKVPIMASSFFRETMLNLLTVKALDIE